MTKLGLVRSALLEEHGDFIREAVAAVAAQLMNAENQRADRRGARGGVGGLFDVSQLVPRPRLWETRVGEIELQIPRNRSGEAHFLVVSGAQARCDQAILAVVMEAYVNGVSLARWTGWSSSSGSTG